MNIKEIFAQYEMDAVARGYTFKTISHTEASVRYFVHYLGGVEDISKVTGDDLDKEIKRKFDVGYPKNNILFQAPNRIVIWQDGQEVFEYRLGNRSALDWVIDQYQVSTDKRSGIVNDPNRLNDPQYIIRLIGKVITISLSTVKIVKSLPALF